MKIQVNSLGKAYLSSDNKLLKADTDTITAVNNTGSNITSGSKVWVNKNGTYSLISFYTNYQDFTKNGSPTINTTTKVVSGFSTSNYLSMDKNPNFSQEAHSNPWEAYAKINISSLNYFNPIYGGGSGSWMPDLYVTANNVLGMSLSSTGSSYDIADGVSGTTVLSANTDYWIKFGWNGTEYYAELSTDGKNYIREVTISSTTPISSRSYQLLIGFRVGNYFHGSIYLNDCFINLNNQRWWSAYFSGIDENTLTGIAQENISAGSSGLVKVMEI